MAEEVFALEEKDGLEQMNTIESNFLAAISTPISNVEKIEAYHNVFDDHLRSDLNLLELPLFRIEECKECKQTKKTSGNYR